MVNSEMRSFDQIENEQISIVVCEDEPQARNLLRRYLDSLNYSVEYTADAESFLKRITDMRLGCDLAIVDIDLPGLNGDQVITWLRASELPELRELPILVTTSYPGLMEDEFFLGIKNAGYLMKPFSSSALAAALNKLLSARGSAGKTD